MPWCLHSPGSKCLSEELRQTVGHLHVDAFKVMAGASCPRQWGVWSRFCFLKSDVFVEGGLRRRAPGSGGSDDSASSRVYHLSLLSSDCTISFCVKCIISSGLQLGSGEQFGTKKGHPIPS